MPIVDIICPICTDVFNNSDEVFSTNCGHLFHFACLNNWLGRERSCPQCRKVCPEYHKLHLSFAVSEQPLQDKEDIQIKIKSSEENGALLQVQINDLEDNFLKLQEQYSLAQSSERELEATLSQMHNSEEDFMRLQAQYTDVTEIRKQFEDSVNQLYVENECKVKELEQRTSENAQLKASLVEQHFTLPNNALGKKIKDIEQKLRISNEALQQEINASYQLSRDNVKLQSLVNNSPLAENRKNDSPNRSGKNSLQNRYVNSVLIKGLPFSQLIAPLENVVLNLASKMHLVLSAGDFSNVNVMNADLEKFSFATLSVQFKNVEIKRAFLSNSKLLQYDANTKTVFVEEFMSDELNELLTYAKKILHNRGLKYFYIENNKVFAKKNLSHSVTVHIKDKDQVDDLAKIYDSMKNP